MKPADTEKKNQDYVYDVVHRYFGGRYASEVEENVQRWLIDQTDREAKSRALETVWDALKVINGRSDVESAARSYRKVWARIDALVPKSVISRRVLWRMVAVLIPVLAITAGVWLYTHRPADAGEITWIDFAVPNGQTAELELPDGSHVKVNAGSTVSYPETFAERTVKLFGEAFFSVVTDPTRPFTVQTRSVTVRVTGTEFNVSAFHDMASETVSVVNGSVEVYVAEQTTGHSLGSGQRLTLDKAQGTVTLDEFSDISWTTGALEFTGNTCEEILRTLGRRYDIPVFFDGGESAKRYTLKFSGDESIEEVLRVLCTLIPDLSCDLREDGVHITFI